MADIISRFNQGVLTTSDLQDQFNDRFWSKGAVREAMRKRTFTQLGDQLTQPKRYGDTIVKERHLPVFHPLNHMDNGIDPSNAAKLMENVWYAYDSTNTQVGNADGYPTRADADAVGDPAHTKSGAGTLFNGDADYAVLSGNYPTLSEDGGNVNAVNARSLTLEGKVVEFGIHMKFTQRSIDMDSREGVLAQKSKDLGEAKGDLFEAQVQSDLLAASETNRLFCGVATSLDTVDETSVLTFQDLRLMEQELKKARCPRDTKVITGSVKIDTKVVGKSYYAYVGQELYPTLQDMSHNGVSVWNPVESYMDGAGKNTAEGEIGRIGNFRFIEVEQMQAYRGEGALDNAGSTDGYHSTDGKFDVFPVLFVGTDSFATVGFAGDSARIKTAMPQPNPYTDPFGKQGSMSISWYFGTLIYRAERIRSLVCSAVLS
jgi:N4-gp56 family major capsid protein